MLLVYYQVVVCISLERVFLISNREINLLNLDKLLYLLLVKVLYFKVVVKLELQNSNIGKICIAKSLAKTQCFRQMQGLNKMQKNAIPAENAIPEQNAMPGATCSA